MSDPVLRRLLDEERLEEVVADPDAARAMVEEAKQHLDSSARIAGSDPNGAYQLLYDAVRKAITAHMRSTGYRPTNRPGAHVAVGEYASAGLLSEDDVRRFQRVRRNRNRSEYETAHFDANLVRSEFRWARHVIETVAAKLS